MATGVKVEIQLDLSDLDAPQKFALYRWVAGVGWVFDVENEAADFSDFQPDVDAELDAEFPENIVA